MRSNFDYCFTQLLKDEGGYSNDPRDPGGATNLGITIADYRLHINPDATPADVRKLTLEQAKTIYRKNYWEALGCDDLPSGLDYTVFDYGVNSGTGRAKRIAAKFANLTDTKAKINAICDERVAFLKGLRNFNVYGKGWLSRVSRVRAKSLKLASGPTTVPAQTSLWTSITGGVAAAWTWAGDHKVAIIVGLLGLGILTSVIIEHINRKNTNA